MLSALELENFKGIAARQRIDFAPLTLLFGANSAGKSTILQALLYLHEILERGSADVDRTELGGNVLELGGFARLVHRHEMNRSIVLRAEFATPGGLERFGRDLSEFPFPNLDDEIESAWLELTIRFEATTMFHGPLVQRAIIGTTPEVGRIGGARNEPRVRSREEPLVWLEAGATLRDGEPLRAHVNLGHPLIAWYAKEKELGETWQRIAVPDEVRESVGASYRKTTDPAELGSGSSWLTFALSRSRMSALPPANESLRVLPLGDVDELRDEARGLDDQPPSAKRESRKREILAAIDARERAAEEVRTFLEMVVLGTTAQLVSFLHDALYIGPLRTIPPRGFLYERAGRITSWADGLAAWDLLLADRGDLVEQTNHWLKRLGTGCQVVVQQLFDARADAEELSEGHVDRTARRLLLDTGNGTLVLPSEVGAGISQVIPIIIAALQRATGVTLVEQPEIHVHPAIQVALGDLLIDAVTREGGRRTLLIETHSEHLILRILRRIRETTGVELEEGAPAFAPDKLNVVYVESAAGNVSLHPLQVDEQGQFVDAWPKGFFDERFEEIYGK